MKDTRGTTSGGSEGSGGATGERASSGGYSYGGRSREDLENDEGGAFTIKAMEEEQSYFKGSLKERRSWSGGDPSKRRISRCGPRRNI